MDHVLRADFLRGVSAIAYSSSSIQFCSNLKNGHFALNFSVHVLCNRLVFFKFFVLVERPKFDPT